MKTPLDAAVYTADDVDCSATGLAESAAQWAKEWTAQQMMRSMTLDKANKQLLARAAQQTALQMRKALDIVEQLRGELEDAARAADEAARWLAQGVRGDQRGPTLDCGAEGGREDGRDDLPNRKRRCS